MKRHLSALVGVGCVLALTGLPITPADAGTVTFPVDSWTVTFTIPDFSYTGNDCEKAPWTADFQGPAYSGSLIKFSAEPRSTPAVDAAAADVTQDTLLVCPALHGSGTFDVTGEATVYEGATSHKGPFTTTFLVNPMATTTVLSGYRAGSYDWIVFQGSVLAHSTRLGDIGAYPGSQVVIEEQVGGGAWTRVTNAIGLDAAGNFSITMYRALTPGAFYRASYLGSTILHATTSCAPSASAPIQAPAPVVQPTPTPSPVTPAPVVQPTPTVKVKAVRRNSKLRVDVDPNRGRGYWTFRVQRKAPDGSWVTLKKTYRTKGSREVRTVNLNRGTYRVWVNPKYGYQGVLSDGEVYLKK